MSRAKQIVAGVFQQAMGKTGYNPASYITKRLYCPVDRCMVTAYEVPLSEIIDALNPARLNDVGEEQVTEMHESLISKGQEHPVLLEWNEDEQKFDAVYGCTRIRASQGAFDSGQNIQGVSMHHVWAKFFCGSDADRNEAVTDENFRAKNPQKMGTREDLVNLLDDRIEIKALSPDKESVKQYVAKTAPQYSKKKFTGLWNALQDQSKTLNGHFKTFNKSSMSRYFARNNTIGYVSSQKWNTKLERMMPQADQSGHIVVYKGKRIAIYYVTKPSEASGGLPTNASKKKWISQKADEVWVVYADNTSTSGKLQASREKFFKDLRAWNNGMKRTFDKVICMPQSSTEFKSLYPAGKFSQTEQL